MGKQLCLISLFLALLCLHFAIVAGQYYNYYYNPYSYSNYYSSGYYNPYYYNNNYYNNYNR